MIMRAYTPFNSLSKKTPNSSWDWNQIDLSDIQYPADFFWGTSSSEYQISGRSKLPDSQWAEWENQDESRIKGGKNSDCGISGWDRYVEDIQLLKEIGVTAYRFSVDWSAIEPKEGHFSREALAHYKDVCEELKRNEITPMITLHHFSHPTWFEKKGGFRELENQKYFIRFAKHIFSQFSSEVFHWCTINEPSVFALMGYILGEFPPGEKNPFLAAKVLKNMLLTHVALYKELKSMKNGELCQIGIVHSYLNFTPYHSFNPIETVPCAFFTSIVNRVVLEFFKTGEFSSILTENEVVADAPESFDFFGLNYYSRPVIKMQLSLSNPLIPSCFEGEVMTDMPYPSYAEGFYDALMDCSKLSKPIYVTENGIADKKDDRRDLFIRRYLYALSKAIQDGVDVKGYFYWTLIDNFEWAEGFTMKFGLYSVSDENQTRKLRDGAKAFQEIIANAKDKQMFVHAK